MQDNSGTTSEPAEPNGGTSGTGGRYSVPEVARLLGISERAVRKRITAGTLDAVKEAGVWIVTLEAVPTEPIGTTGGTGTAPQQAADPGSQNAPPDQDHRIIDELRARIADLELDRDRWHDQAQHEQENVRGLIVALSRAENRIDELLAIAAPPASPQDAGSGDSEVEDAAPDGGNPRCGRSGAYRPILALVVGVVVAAPSVKRSCDEGHVSRRVGQPRLAEHGPRLSSVCTRRCDR
jgi:hypothetical protein